MRLYEFYDGYKFLEKNKVARRWLLSKIREFGEGIS